MAGAVSARTNKRQEEKIEAVREAITATIYREPGISDRARLATRIIHAVEKVSTAKRPRAR